jgi:glucose-1-phosphate cytidylyltransferase
MKAVILAGGKGTRISEETIAKPKPMIEIGNKPILWHIMKIYSTYNINEFIICLGYKGYMIKEYFLNYYIHQSDITINLKDNSYKILQNSSEPWSITLVDTGEETMTGGRVKRIKPFVENETFLMTYGDGVSDVNIRDSITFHKKHGKMATLVAVQPPGRYGSLHIIDDNKISTFVEKPQGDGGFINGGFFVLEPGVFDFINGDQTIWEREPLESLASMNQLRAYKHLGFWQSMDTLRDKIQLEELWEGKNPPWKVW